MGKQSISFRKLRLVLFIFFLLTVATHASALEVIPNITIPDEVKEGEIIDITLEITGIPPAADYISIDSDLEKNGTDPFFTIADLNITSHLNNYQLPLNETITSLTVHIKGRTPTIKDIDPVDKVTLIKFDPKRTGYAYYRITFSDESGKPLKESDTKTFSIYVPEIALFGEKLNTINDPFLRKYLQELFDKGLVVEANELADYLNSKDKGRTVPLLWVMGGLVITLIIGLVIGMRIRNSEED